MEATKTKTIFLPHFFALAPGIFLVLAGTTAADKPYASLPGQPV
jgi:hypothetical protein